MSYELWLDFRLSTFDFRRKNGIFTLKNETMNIWGFICAAVLLTLMPGPDILFVITQSITRGGRAAFVFALGLCTGLLFHVLAVSLGVSALLVGSPLAFTVMKCGGAGYLFYLGIKAFLNRNKTSLRLETDQTVAGRLYGRGIVMNLLNPKVILFFLAFLPQFVTSGTEQPLVQLLFLGFLFMIQALVVFSIVALLADKLSARLMKHPGIAFRMNIAEALIYAGIGVSLLFVGV